MIKRIKSISKRTLALLLALMTLMSVGITNIVALETELAETGATPATLYLKAGVWDVDDAIFRAWVWGGNTDDKWIYFTKNSDGVYEAPLGGTYTGIKILRCAPNSTEWSSWNDSGDQSIPQNGDNCFNVNGWGSYSWSKYTPSYNVKKSETGTTGGTVKLGSTTLSTTGTSISAGSYALSITAPTGYNVRSVSVTGGTLTTPGTTGSSIYSGTVNVSAATTITVTYVAAKVKVSVADSDYRQKVEINSEERDEAEFDPGTTNITVKITPVESHKITAVSGGGTVELNADGSATVTISSITSNVILTATYTKRTYSITLIKDGEYDDTCTAVADKTEPSYGDDVTLTATAGRGYRFVGWKLQGSDTIVSEENELEISNVVESWNYIAVFEKITAKKVTITSSTPYQEFSVTVKDTANNDVAVTKTTDTNSETYNADVYDGEKVNLTAHSYTYGYISKFEINGVECKDVEEYYTNGTKWFRIVYTFTVGEDLTADENTIDIVHSDNPKVTSEVKSGKGTITTSNSTATVDYKKTGLTYTATAEDGYYIASVIDTNNNKTYYSGNDASVTELNAEDIDTVTSDVHLEVVFAPKAYNLISVKGEDTDGNAVDLGAVVLTVNEKVIEAQDDGRYMVEQGATVNVVVTQTPTSEYYIAELKYEGNSVGSRYAKETMTVTENITASAADTVETTSTLTVIYAKRDKFTVTVENEDPAGGSLVGNTKTGLFTGETVVIKPTANNGYAFDKWVVTGTGYSQGNGYTINSATNEITITVKGDVTVKATWKENPYLTVTLRAPKSQGSATGTYNGSQVLDTNSSTTSPLNSYSQIVKGETVTLSATANTDNNYKFTSWQIAGDYKITSGSLTSSSITIEVNDNVTATATFEKSGKIIYAKNRPSGWNKSGATELYAAFYDGSGNVCKKLTYDSSTATWSLEIPETSSLTWIKFCDENSTNPGNNKEFSGGPFADGTVFDVANGTKTAGTTTSSGGAYSIKYGDTTVTMDDYGDGLYYGVAEVPAETESIEVNPYSTADKYYYNLTGEAGANSANVVKATTANTKGTSVPVSIGSNEGGAEVAFTFDPDKGTLSWKVSNLKVKLTVTILNGMYNNQLDKEEATNETGMIGTTSMDYDGVRVLNFTETTHTSPTSTRATAVVAKGEPVTIKGKIEDRVKKDGVPIYRIAGWVVNDTEIFIPATTTDNENYTGTYAFDQNATITPIYFHTDEWMTTNGVEKITVYAIMDKSIPKWNTEITTYTWFYTEGTDDDNVYTQFGDWTGQLMIPMGNNVFYTYVEANTPKKDDVESTTTGDPYSKEITGITFTSNYYRGTTNSNWVQAYDYYEFVSLKNKYNITYVLKYHNKTQNNDKTAETTEIGQTLGHTGYSTFGAYMEANYTFTDYVDYNGNPMDIYRTVTSVNASVDAQAAAIDNTLYIVRTGPEDYLYTKEDPNATGQYYVEAHVFDSTGYKIDTCVTYELVDRNSEFFTKLTERENTLKADDPEFTFALGNVKVSYESESSVNGTLRYDGEWYGDETDTTQITVNAVVGVKNGTTEIYDKCEFIGGTATINSVKEDGVSKVSITRGDEVNLFASELAGYKFIGWYYVNTENGVKTLGDCFSTETSLWKDFSVQTTVAAIYRVRSVGEFEVSNEKYTGLDSSALTPKAYGGDSYRYVSIVQRNSQGELVATYDKTLNAINDIKATEGDKFTITIYTDAILPDDYFYAWYVPVWDVVDDQKIIVNFEEVQVTEQNQGQYGEVSFTFEYTYKTGDPGIRIYSDCYHFTLTKDLVYQYKDRYGNTKVYIKPKYTLTNEEVQNGKVPSEETILKNAPWVDDLFKDTEWKFDESKFSNESWTLVATQTNTKYKVTFHAGDEFETFEGEYNTPVEFMANWLNTDATNKGYWYTQVKDKDGNVVKDENGDDVIEILGYGTYYGLVLTEDVDIYYCFGDDVDLDYKVVLGEPTYGRVQEGVNGSTSDKIYTDYLASIHVPIFVGDTTDEQIKIDKNYQDDEIVVSLNSPVTLETLEKYGYKVEYGIITEQVGTFKVDGTTNVDFDAAEEKAVNEGYKKATSIENLTKIIASDLNKGWGVDNFKLDAKKLGENDEYYTVYDLTPNGNITNKNRYPFTLILNNTDANRGRFYNVYAYFTIAYDANNNSKIDADEIKYYFSDLQTLNIYDAGTNIIDGDGNTSKA